MMRLTLRFAVATLLGLGGLLVQAGPASAQFRGRAPVVMRPAPFTPRPAIRPATFVPASSVNFQSRRNLFNASINPNFLIAPGLTIGQAAFNTAVLGRAYQNVPPYALGFNPYLRTVNYPPVYPMPVYSSMPVYTPYVVPVPVYNPYLTSSPVTNYVPGVTYNPYEP
jgi:hypothetical protein